MDNNLFMLFLACTVGIVMLTLAFMYLVYIFRNRKNSEYLERHFNKSEQLTGQVQEYENLLYQVSRDIHDLFGQTASHLGILVSMMEDDIKRGNAIELQSLQPISKLAKQIVLDASYLGKSHNTDYVNASPLEELLDEALEYTGKRNDLKVRMDFDSRFELKPIQRVLLFRIAQEAMRNIGKHAMAKHVMVNVADVNGSFRMEISDDGLGFNSDNVYHNSLKGIAGMKLRASLLNGEVNIKTKAMNGSQVIFTMAT